jgi:hypothetical protein
MHLRQRIKMNPDRSVNPDKRHRQWSLRQIILLLAMSAARVALADDPKLDTPPQKEAPTAFAAKKPTPVRDWGEGEGKSGWVPAYEIPTFELLLNRYDHYVVD